ncbi:MAG TPA: tRNA lysidine(34) synthetase TilS, partial [Thermomicrobiales bacterium]|nr:tRNA lysidine(34) synthetase TilS [Thermomicrobiales bacterium]
MDAPKLVNDILPHASFLGLEQRLLARWRGRPSPAAGRLVVGFSGGADSLALALALGRIAGRAAVQIVLAHIDHRQRSSSGEEAERARALAAGLNLAFATRHIPEQIIQRHVGVGREEALRRERYRLLATIANEQAADALALAHHADDQAETILLHLLRGAGGRGAAAMAEWTERPVPWWPETSADPMTIVVWRPFLTEPRAALRDYVSRSGLDPIEDPTNDDPLFRRNAIRRDVLPLLERIAPGAGAALARHATLAAADDAALAAFAAAALARASDSAGGVRVAPLRLEPAVVRGRALRAWVAESAPDVELSAERTAAALALVERGRGGIEIGSGWRIDRRGGVLRLRQGGERA